jgi:hypothetical protein
MNTQKKPTAKTMSVALHASVALAAMLLLAGCGGGKPPGGQGAGSQNSSPQAKLEKLETTGEIPKLDRLPTLEGADANQNGVRDDIEDHIRKKYPEPKQQAAAMQMARSMQSAVTVNVRDSQMVHAVSEAQGLAVTCVKAVFPREKHISTGSLVLTEIESMTTNTKARLLAYLAYNRALSGSVWKLPKGDTCE